MTFSAQNKIPLIALAIAIIVALAAMFALINTLDAVKQAQMQAQQGTVEPGIETQDASKPSASDAVATIEQSGDSTIACIKAPYPADATALAIPDDASLLQGSTVTKYKGGISGTLPNLNATWSIPIDIEKPVQSAWIYGVDVSSKLETARTEFLQTQPDSNEKQTESEPQAQPKTGSDTVEKTETTTAKAPDPTDECFITASYTHFHSTKECPLFEQDVTDGLEWDRTTVERAETKLGFTKCPECYPSE